MQGHINYFLNHSRRGNVLIVTLIAISIICFTLETEFSGNRTLFALNYVIAIIFGIEYFARIWVAPLRFNGHSRPRLHYIFSFYGLIDLLAFLPALLVPMAQGSVILRLLRVLRLFQLMKIQAVTNGIRRIGEAIYETRVELIFSIFISLALIFLGAVAMYFVEGPYNPEAFGSIPRALWWSMATLTTVGYGDVYPVTAVGKITASIIALVGIIAVAMPAGILASAFSNDDLQDAPKKVPADPLE